MTYAIESFIDFCDDMTIAEEGLLDKAITGLQRVFAKLVLKIDNKVKKMKDGKIKKILTGLLNRAKRGLVKCKHLNANNPELVKELQGEAEEIEEELEEIKEELKEVEEEIKEEIEEDTPNYKPTNVRKNGNIKYGSVKRGEGKYSVKGRRSNEVEPEETKPSDTYKLTGSRKDLKAPKSVGRGNKVEIKEGHKVKSPDGTIKEYDNDGKLKMVKNPDGSSVGYSPIGSVHWKMDKNGKKVFYLNGRITAIKYPDNREEHYCMDGKTIRTIEYPDGSTTHYKDGKKQKHVYKDGTEEAYYANGKLKYRTTKDGKFAVLYDESGKKITLDEFDKQKLYSKF